MSLHAGDSFAGHVRHMRCGQRKPIQWNVRSWHIIGAAQPETNHYAGDVVRCGPMPMLTQLALNTDISSPRHLAASVFGHPAKLRQANRKHAPHSNKVSHFQQFVHWERREERRGLGPKRHKQKRRVATLVRCAQSFLAGSGVMQHRQQGGDRWARVSAL